MTLDEFKIDLLAFLQGSTVNLGRQGTKTRQIFMDDVGAKFNAFADSRVKPREVFNVDEEKKPAKNPMANSVKCIKPTNSRRALDVGKGVHAMTSSESMRADEELNRSPYSSKKKEKEDE